MLRHLFLLLVFAVGACGTTKNTTQEGISPNRIDVSELSYATEVVSAYDIIRQHKANWLNKRGRSSLMHPTPIKVYLDNDGSSLGSIKSLRRIDGQDIATIEYYNPRRAHLKFGSGNNSGAILVRTLDGAEDE